MIQDNLIFNKFSYKEKILNETSATEQSEFPVGEWNLSGLSKNEKKKRPLYVSLEAANCTAQIEKLDSTDALSSFRRRTQNEISHGYLRSRIEDLELKEFKQDCSICFEEIKELKILDCHHHFCDSCIIEWAKVNSNCPICRKQIL